MAEPPRCSAGRRRVVSVQEAREQAADGQGQRTGGAAASTQALAGLTQRALPVLLVAPVPVFPWV